MKPKLSEGALVEVIAKVLRIVPREESYREKKFSKPTEPVGAFVDALILPEKVVLDTPKGEIVYEVPFLDEGFLRQGDRVKARINELYLDNKSLGYYVDGHVVKF